MLKELKQMFEPATFEDIVAPLSGMVKQLENLEERNSFNLHTVEDQINTLQSVKSVILDENEKANNFKENLLNLLGGNQ